MTRVRSAESLADEAARWRRSFREAQQVILEQNGVLLRTYLAGRLADPGDFELNVGTATVVDSTGRIRWAQVEAATAELLLRKPHLAAAPRDAVPFNRGSVAVEWFQSGSL